MIAIGQIEERVERLKSLLKSDDGNFTRSGSFESIVFRVQALLSMMDEIISLYKTDPVLMEPRLSMDFCPEMGSRWDRVLDSLIVLNLDVQMIAEQLDGDQNSFHIRSTLNEITQIDIQLKTLLNSIDSLFQEEVRQQKRIVSFAEFRCNGSGGDRPILSLDGTQSFYDAQHKFMSRHSRQTAHQDSQHALFRFNSMLNRKKNYALVGDELGISFSHLKRSLQNSVMSDDALFDLLEDRCEDVKSVYKLAVETLKDWSDSFTEAVRAKTAPHSSFHVNVAEIKRVLAQVDHTRSAFDVLEARLSGQLDRSARDNKRARKKQRFLAAVIERCGNSNSEKGQSALGELFLVGVVQSLQAMHENKHITKDLSELSIMQACLKQQVTVLDNILQHMDSFAPAATRVDASRSHSLTDVSRQSPIYSLYNEQKTDCLREKDIEVLLTQWNVGSKPS